MKKERIISISIIAGLIVVIILMQQCGGWKDRCPDPEIKTVVKHDTIKGDTEFVPVEVVREVPVPVVREVVKWQERASEDVVEGESEQGRIDRIIMSHYSVNQYKDTLIQNDVELVIHENIFMNELSGRQLWIKNNRPTAISSSETTEIKYQRQKFKVYIGGLLGGSKDHFSAGASLMMIPRRDNFAFQYAFDAVGGTHMGIVQWKISFKKRNKVDLIKSVIQ